jgi:hypothetical protein
MTEHPGVEGMRVAGFSVLPMLNSSGIDDALLFWRWSEDGTVLDAVAAWSDDYAVWARLPSDRDWTEPFRPTARQRNRPVAFEEVVRAVQPRLRPRPPTGPPGDAGWFGLDQQGTDDENS